MVIIRAAVGRGGKNDPDDVRIVQRLLNEASPSGQGPLTIDGIAGPETTAAIQAFQKMGGHGADGRVDPGGITIKRLVRAHLELVAAGLDPGALELAKGYSLPQTPMMRMLLSEYFRLLREF